MSPGVAHLKAFASGQPSVDSREATCRQSPASGGRNLPGKQGVARELLKAREPWAPGPLQRTPPQIALVGVGRITERPWTVDGMLAVRRALFLSLAGDRRASDDRRDGRSSAPSHPT